MAVAIGNLGTIPAFQVGGNVFTDITNIIICYGTVQNTTRYTTMRKAASSSGYQVTAGKTYTIQSIDGAIVNNNGEAVSLIPLYGDTDVGLDSASAPTNPVYIAGDTTSTGAYFLAGSATSGAGKIFNPRLNFAVPAQKYPCVKQLGGNSVTTVFYGYET